MKKYSILILLFIFQFYFSQSIEVEGSVSNTKTQPSQTNEVDFSESNLAYTTVRDADNIVLKGIKNGGAYTLVCTYMTSDKALTFSTDNNLPIMYMGTTARTPNRAHIYSFVVIGNRVYVTINTKLIS